VTPPERPRRRWFRPWPRVPDDDLLAGFDRAGRPRRLQVFFATTIAASLLVWNLAFALGAYHTVFYSRLFEILVVSTVLLMGSIILRKTIRVRPWMRVVLAIPLAWLLQRSLAPFGHATRAGRVLDDGLIALTVASVPFTLWALARVVVPEYFALPSRRMKIVSVLIVAMVGGAGFLVGQFNYVFTTCEQYVLAGDDQPSDCRPPPPPPPPSP
jgi:hypothetical protein